MRAREPTIAELKKLRWTAVSFDNGFVSDGCRSPSPKLARQLHRCTLLLLAWILEQARRDVCPYDGDHYVCHGVK